MQQFWDASLLQHTSIKWMNHYQVFDWKFRCGRAGMHCKVAPRCIQISPISHTPVGDRIITVLQIHKTHVDHCLRNLVVTIICHTNARYTTKWKYWLSLLLVFKLWIVFDISPWSKWMKYKVEQLNFFKSCFYLHLYLSSFVYQTRCYQPSCTCTNSINKRWYLKDKKKEPSHTKKQQHIRVLW